VHVDFSLIEDVRVAVQTLTSDAKLPQQDGTGAVFGNQGFTAAEP
jgi:hypothetical protein